jgi:hypothetical protein
VSVGTDHDTASFAVNAIRRWWLSMGRGRYFRDAGIGIERRLEMHAQRAVLDVTVAGRAPELVKGTGILKTARLFGLGTSTVQRLKQASAEAPAA